MVNIWHTSMNNYYVSATIINKENGTYAVNSRKWSQSVPQRNLFWPCLKNYEIVNTGQNGDTVHEEQMAINCM